MGEMDSLDGAKDGKGGRDHVFGHFWAERGDKDLCCVAGVDALGTIPSSSAIPSSSSTIPSSSASPPSAEGRGALADDRLGLCVAAVNVVAPHDGGRHLLVCKRHKPKPTRVHHTRIHHRVAQSLKVRTQRVARRQGPNPAHKHSVPVVWLLFLLVYVTTMLTIHTYNTC